MHLTLHYIGEAEIDRIATALGKLTEPVFVLSLRGIGQFPSADGAVTLWAGVQDCPELRMLHANVATALSGEGFRCEDRAYRPHVTLARCEPTVAAGVIDDFLVRQANFSLPAVVVMGFSVYSSEFVAGIPVYRLERTFSLHAPT